VNKKRLLANLGAVAVVLLVLAYAGNRPGTSRRTTPT